MTEQQADKIIALLQDMNSQLSTLSEIKSHLHGIEDDVEDIKEAILENNGK